MTKPVRLVAVTRSRDDGGDERVGVLHGSKRESDGSMFDCDLCGVHAPTEDLPLSWAVSFARDLTTSYYCGPCARAHLHSIEGRFDPAGT